MLAPPDKPVARKDLANGSTEDDLNPQKPFANVNVRYYAQTPSLVPVYVLDRLLEAHYKELQQNSNVNVNQSETGASLRTHTTKRVDEQQYSSFSNDTFIKAINNNWRDLMVTVKEPCLYTPDQLEKIELPGRYDTPWGGDERLRLALVGQTAYDHSTDSDRNVGFWTRMFSKRSRHPDDLPRVRSKAGYWMLDEKRKDLAPTLRRILVHSPLFPLLMRILILMFSSCALALAASIYVYSKRKYDDSDLAQQPSTIFAIVVQCCAIVYVIYIAYDEYTGKPLGLRNPLGKMKLIMLDLLFIICMSANLSLTFYSLYDDEWVCTSNNTQPLQALGIYYPTVNFLCRRQRALASFLFLVLCLWVVVFTVSIIRVVDRVSISPRRI